MTPTTPTPTPDSLGAATGSPFPFECENCGHKPTPQEVLDHHGDCAKCRDTVITYTVDAAECIVRLIDRQKTLMAALVDLRAATRILTRCRDSAGRVEIGLYEDIQNFLHTQP